MMACTSPCGTVRSIPFSIGLSPIEALSPRISSIRLSHRSFKRNRQEVLRLDGELHRQFLQYVFAEAVDDQADGIFLRQPALAAVEQLVVGDLRGRRLV